MNERATKKPSGCDRRRPITLISPRCSLKRRSSSAWNASSGKAMMRSASALERQNGERAGRQKMLFGPPMVVAFVLDVYDDCRLVVDPTMGRDAGLAADTRSRPVSGDEKAG